MGCHCGHHARFTAYTGMFLNVMLPVILNRHRTRRRICQRRRSGGRLFKFIIKTEHVERVFFDAVPPVINGFLALTTIPFEQRSTLDICEMQQYDFDAAFDVLEATCGR